jgi:hypothetical protein
MQRLRRREGKRSEVSLPTCMLWSCICFSLACVIFKAPNTNNRIPRSLSNLQDSFAFQPAPPRPSWCLDQPAKNASEPVYLGAAIHTRIYPHTDLANLTFDDLAHWMTYVRYSGVERVYLYDTYQRRWEKTLQHPAIQAGVDSNFIVYVDWSSVALANTNPKTGKRKGDHLAKVQVPAFTDAQQRAVDTVRWMTFTDMDEFIYAPNDESPGFLYRFLQRSDPMNTTTETTTTSSTAATSAAGTSSPNTTQWFVQNILADGGRDPSLGPTLMQQVPRIGTSAANHLGKQIVKLQATKAHGVHTSSTNFGESTTAPADELYMRHLLGGRRTKWKMLAQMEEEAKEKVLQNSIPNNMTHLAEQILKCF